MACVYRHIRLDKNEPFYIGVGKSCKRAEDVSDRSFDWMKIAVNGYESEIIFDDVDIEFAFKKEIEFISLYGRIKNGTGTLVNNSAGGRGNATHHWHKYPLYSSYENIIKLGRPICSEWRDNFLLYNDWCIKNGWNAECKIYRKNVNKEYSPDNCEVKSYLKYEYNGSYYTVYKLSKSFNIPRTCIYKRIKLGWSINEIISTPAYCGNRIKNKKQKNVIHK